MHELLKDIIRVIGCLVEVHVAAASIGFGRMYFGAAAKEVFVSPGALGALQRESMRKDFSGIISNGNWQYLFLGERHTDLRLYSFIAEQQTLQTLAEAGVKHIFIESPLGSQKKINAVARGEKVLGDTSKDSTSGGEIGLHRAWLKTRMIRRAKAFGIDVHASDVNAKFDRFLLLNALALDTEMSLVRLAGFKNAAHSITHQWGALPLFHARVDDRRAAKFIEKIAQGSRSVVIRGRSHFLVESPNSLRAQLPASLTITTCDAPKEGQDESSANLDDSLIKGLGLDSPDHFINFAAGRISRYETPAVK